MSNCEPLTPAEKAMARGLVAAWTMPCGDDEMEIVAWNYGSEMAAMELPWKENPDRAGT